MLEVVFPGRPFDPNSRLCVAAHFRDRPTERLSGRRIDLRPDPIATPFAADNRANDDRKI